MSHTLLLPCGCAVYVLCDPETRVARRRLIVRRGTACAVARHRVGLRLYLWELLPQPRAAMRADLVGRIDWQ